MSSDHHELITIIYETALDRNLWSLVFDGLVQAADLHDGHPSLSRVHLQHPAKPRCSVDLNQGQSPERHDTINAIAASIDDDSGCGSVDDYQLFDRIKPHLQRAVQLRLQHKQVEQKLDTVTQLMDSVPVGVLLVDEHGRVLCSNAKAGTLLDEGAILGCQDGYLQASDEVCQRQLLDAIRELCRSQRASSPKSLHLHDKRGAKTALLLARMQYRHGTSFCEATGVAVLMEPAAGVHGLSDQALRDTYGFTRAECQVARQLLKNCTLDKIAAARRVSINTVRNQVFSILQKTDTHRQSELVCRLLSSATTIQHSSSATQSPPGKRAPQRGRSNDVIERQIRLDDGRRMGYAEYGDPAGRPVVFCHSVYGCRYEIPPGHYMLRDHNLRFVIPDRPGVGLSDPRCLSAYTDWVDDLVQLAAHLGLGRFDIAGFSAGGNYALAAAWRLPMMIDRVLVVSPTPPMTSLRDLGAVPATHKIALALAMKLPNIAVQVYGALSKGAMKSPERFLSEILPAAALEKRELALPDIREVYRACIPEMVKHGTRGMPLELCYLVQRWNFDLTGIRQPIQFWRGQVDGHVPAVIAEKLMAEIPGATVRRFPDRGHMILHTEWNSLVEELADSSESEFGERNFHDSARRLETVKP